LRSIIKWITWQAQAEGCRPLKSQFRVQVNIYFYFLVNWVGKKQVGQLRQTTKAGSLKSPKAMKTTVLTNPEDDASFSPAHIVQCLKLLDGMNYNTEASHEVARSFGIPLFETMIWNVEDRDIEIQAQVLSIAGFWFKKIEPL
jgi:hypothetical protein